MVIKIEQSHSNKITQGEEKKNCNQHLQDSKTVIIELFVSFFFFPVWNNQLENGKKKNPVKHE